MFRRKVHFPDKHCPASILSGVSRNITCVWVVVPRATARNTHRSATRCAEGAGQCRSLASPNAMPGIRGSTDGKDITRPKQQTTTNRHENREGASGALTVCFQCVAKHSGAVESAGAPHGNSVSNHTTSACLHNAKQYEKQQRGRGGRKEGRRGRQEPQAGHPFVMGTFMITTIGCGVGEQRYAMYPAMMRANIPR